MMREDDRGSLTSAPFAGQGAISTTERLGQQYQFDRRVNECIRANTIAPQIPPAGTQRGTAN